MKLADIEKAMEIMKSDPNCVPLPQNYTFGDLQRDKGFTDEQVANIYSTMTTLAEDLSTNNTLKE